MDLILVVAVLALLGLAAQAWGADSRDISFDGREPAMRSGLV
jgi:hypothetical protein